MAIAAVPSLGIASGASSMAAGVGLVAVGVTVILARVHGAMPWSTLLGGARWVLAALLLALAHGAVGALISRSFDLPRFTFSWLLAVVVTVAAAALAVLADRIPGDDLDRGVRWTYLALLGTGFVGVLGYSPFFDTPKPVIFWQEPSHYALSLLPFLFYVVVRSGPRQKIVTMLVAFALAALLESATLVIGSILVLGIAAGIRRALPVALIVAVAAALGLADLDYYMDRIPVPGESSNLSALAFIQGWERVALNLRDSAGMGVGFQQFGIVGDQGDIQYDFEMMGLTDLNKFDGATAGSKFIAEFGVFAALALLLYLARFARRGRWLAAVSAGPAAAAASPQRILFTSTYLGFAIDLFVRGAGYFSSSGFMFLTSLVWLTMHAGDEGA